MPAPTLTAEHFARARDQIRRRRDEVEAVYAAAVKELDDEQADIDRMEESAKAFAAKYANEPPDGEPAEPEPSSSVSPAASERQFSSHKEMVLAAIQLMDTDGKGATRSDIDEYIKQIFGWEIPENSITTYLGRLRKDGLIEFVDQRWHRSL